MVKEAKGIELARNITARPALGCTTTAAKLPWHAASAIPHKPKLSSAFDCCSIHPFAFWMPAVARRQS